eukprot:Clim_evm21s149 gene=Clim_evmTU21s149
MSRSKQEEILELVLIEWIGEERFADENDKMALESMIPLLYDHLKRDYNSQDQLDAASLRNILDEWASILLDPSAQGDERVYEYDRLYNLLDNYDVLPKAQAGGEETEHDYEPGCEICGRDTFLTRHHLIPKTTHARMKNRYSAEALNECAMLCRPCHSAVHSRIDNTTLAVEYNTVEKLLQNQQIIKFASFISKQPCRTRQDAHRQLRYRK